jgi:hypothetical protein
MVNGSINSDGSDNDGVNISKTRFRTRNVIKIKKGTVLALGKAVYALTNFNFGVYEYYANGTIKSVGDWVNFWRASDDTYIRLLGRRYDNSNIGHSDIAAFADEFRVIPPDIKNHYSIEGGPIRSINHAGMPPLNTIPGFKNAYNAGFHIQEFDCRITQDNVWVCIHNATINATARNADGSVIQ